MCLGNFLKPRGWGRQGGAALLCPSLPDPPTGHPSHRACFLTRMCIRVHTVTHVPHMRRESHQPQQLRKASGSPLQPGGRRAGPSHPHPCPHPHPVPVAGSALHGGRGSLTLRWPKADGRATCSTQHLPCLTPQLQSPGDSVCYELKATCRASLETAAPTPASPPPGR